MAALLAPATAKSKLLVPFWMKAQPVPMMPLVLVWEVPMRAAPELPAKVRVAPAEREKAPVERVTAVPLLREVWRAALPAVSVTAPSVWETEAPERPTRSRVPLPVKESVLVETEKGEVAEEGARRRVPPAISVLPV